MAKRTTELTHEIIKDFGSFGNSGWKKHLTYVKWGDNEPKYDIRSWNEDMTKCGKGVTLDEEDLLVLAGLLTDVGQNDVKDDSVDDYLDEEDEDCEEE